MKRYDYLKPKSLKEAISLKAQYGPRAMFIAGGTDVIVGIKAKKFSPEVLISLNGIEGMSYIREEDGHIKIGALTTHRDLERSGLVAEKLRGLWDAVRNLGSVQIRNVATIGGNICNAAPSADTAPPLLVHNATVVLEGSGGRRSLPLEEFFTGPGRTAIGEDEVLLEFVLPTPPETAQSAYWKHSRRQAMDLAIIGVAVYLDVELKDAEPLRRVFDDPASSWDEQLRALDESEVICRELRLALGVAAPTPLRTKEAEKVALGQRLSSALLSEVGFRASEEARPRDTWRGAAWYRREMIRVLPKRLALMCLKRILWRFKG